jgi:chromosomal replication initiation ATPase DnaA
MTAARAKSINDDQQAMAPETGLRRDAGDYDRLADEFSRVYAETKDIAATLEILDARRPLQSVARPIPELPRRVIEIAASFFYVTPASRLLRPGRHRDLCSARWIAAWLLRRQQWTLAKIAAFLRLDHSTVIHGLRRVRETEDLLWMARAAEELLQSFATSSVRLTE